MGKLLPLVFLIAAAALSASDAGASTQNQAPPVPAPISLCSAYADRASFGGRTIAVEGVYESDQLHAGFTSADCPDVGFGVRTGDITPERREALDRHLISVRNGRLGGWMAVPIIFVGDLRPAGEFGGWELWVTDFSVP